MWADQGRGVIEMMAFDGSDQTVFVNTTDSAKPFQLAINGDKLYWTTENSQLFSSMSLLGPRETVLLDIFGVGNNPKLNGIATVDSNKRPENGMFKTVHSSFYFSLSLSLVFFF